MSETKMPSNSAPFSLREIVDATRGSVVKANIEYSISELDSSKNGISSEEFDISTRGVVTDSRAVSADSLFVALRGERFDGHDFLPQIAQNGARVAVVESTENAPQNLLCVRVPDTLRALGDLARFHRARFQIPVIGVTGSYGKTTTRALIAAAISPLNPVLSTRGNFNNEIGLPQTLLQLDETHRAVVLEMGMRGLGQIEYLADIARPTIGVITNVGPQHVELLESVENVARAKAELIEKLPQNGVAILLADGEFATFLREKAPCRVLTFGVNPDADFRVSSTRTSENGNVEAQISHENSIYEIQLPLPGAHNATNAAAALAVAKALGIDLNDAARALEKAEIPGARLRIVRTEKFTILDDCYNAGPNSMRAALQTLRDFPATKRRIAVLGSMRELGNFSDDEHRKLGVLSNEICDAVCFVGAETRVALQENNAAIWCENADEAALRVLDFAQNGDVILVKGSRSVGLERVVNALAN